MLFPSLFYEQQLTTRPLRVSPSHFSTCLSTSTRYLSDADYAALSALEAVRCVRTVVPETGEVQWRLVDIVGANDGSEQVRPLARE